MNRVETRGSVWIFDDALGRYMRMPKEEKQRPEEWSQGALEDLTWHEMESWQLVTDLDSVAGGWRLSPNGLPWLMIHLSGDWPVVAPNAETKP